MSMTGKEFAAWTAMTEASAHYWTEDEIYRLNGRGTMYYIGGADEQDMDMTMGGM
jgi:hypothetical protein